MIQWKIGCSGYHYPEWRGLFYPTDLAKNKWFAYYCEHFNTIELNTTFYKFPRVEFLRNWYTNSPGNFVFSVKAPRLITHFKKFKDAQRYLFDFYNAVRDGLQEKLGCVLFQFPANFQFEQDYLDRIVDLVDNSFLNVVEFRHSSWWDDKILRVFSENKIIFSGMSHPALPDGVIKTGNIIYYRFHGVPHLFTSKYEDHKLEEVAEAVQHHNDTTTAYIYFNNTAEGAAVGNARKFQEIAELVH